MLVVGSHFEISFRQVTVDSQVGGERDRLDFSAFIWSSLSVKMLLNYQA